MPRPQVALALVATLAVAASCSHEQKVSQSPAPPPPPSAPPVARAPKPAPPPVIVERAKNKEPGAIFFDFDSAVLRDDARPVLQTVAEAVREQPAKVEIAGNCDELGTIEYNLALGDQRARAAKEYLVHMGVPADRIATVSYGSQKPKYPGHDDGVARQEPPRRSARSLSGTRHPGRYDWSRLMSPTLPSLKRAAVALVLLNAFDGRGGGRLLRVGEALPGAQRGGGRLSRQRHDPGLAGRRRGRENGRDRQGVSLGERTGAPAARTGGRRQAGSDGADDRGQHRRDRGKAEPRAAAGIRETVSRRVQRPSFWKDSAPRSKGHQRKPAQTPHSGPRGLDRPAGVAGDQEARRAGRRARAGPPWSRAQPRV